MVVRAFPGINSTLAVWLLAGVSCITGALLAFLLQPKHLLDWPLRERQSARLFVDGQKLPLSNQNPLHLRTRWSAKSIVLERAGFRAVQFDVRGTRALLAPTPLRPVWTATATQGLREQLARLTRTTHAKLRLGASPADYTSERRELLTLARQLEPAADPEHLQLVDNLNRLLRTLPHPLETPQPDIATTPLWTVGSDTLRHSSPVWALTLSPDGRLVASGAQDGGILIHATDDGEQVMALNGHQAGVTSLAFHPSSPLLFSSGYDGRVLKWDIESQSSQLLTSVRGSVTRTALNAAGTLLAFDASGRAVTIWQLDGNKPLWRYQTSSKVRQLEFWDELHQLAILHESALDVVDLDSGKLATQIENRIDAERITYQPERNEVQFIGKAAMLKWSLAKGTETARFQSSSDVIGVGPARSWTAEFQLRKPSNRVKLYWNKQDYVLPIGQRIGTRIDFHTQRQIAAVATIGGRVFIHRLVPKSEISPVPPKQSWRRVAFDATGDRLILGAEDGTIAVLDCHTRRLDYNVEGNGQHPHQLLVSALTNELWIEDGVGLRSIALDAPGQRKRIDGARNATLTADGRLLAYVIGDTGRAKLSVLDLSSGRELLQVDLPDGISNLVFGDNQRLYASVDSPKIVTIDLDQASVTTLQSEALAATLSQLTSIDWLRWINGRLYIASKENVFALDLVGGVVDKVEVPGAVASLAGFGWSDRWLAVTPGNIVRFDGQQRTHLRVGSSAQRYSSVEFSPCGRYVAVALGNGRVAVFE